MIGKKGECYKGDVEEYLKYTKEFLERYADRKDIENKIIE